MPNIYEKIIKDMPPNTIKQICKLALIEDLAPNGDISCKFLENSSQSLRAQIQAREPGIFSGEEIVDSVLRICAEFLEINSTYHINYCHKNSEAFMDEFIVVDIEAEARLLLAAERTMLNFLQRLSGVASKTSQLVKLIQPYNVKLLDTRKTTPGLRQLEKAAFVHGGGSPHRYNLSDMVMLKENHLALLDNDYLSAIANIKANISEETKIEVEVNRDNLDKLAELCESPVDIIMLDNFRSTELAELTRAIKDLNPEILIEASGGIKEENLIDYAKTGVDYISTSSVYTDVKNLDLSLLVL